MQSEITVHWTEWTSACIHASCFWDCEIHALPWCLQEVRGTPWGPCVETSRSSPRNTPSTPKPILDSDNFGTVKFPLQRHRTRARKVTHQNPKWQSISSHATGRSYHAGDTHWKGTGVKSSSLMLKASRAHHPQSYAGMQTNHKSTVKNQMDNFYCFGQKLLNNL